MNADDAPPARHWQDTDPDLEPAPRRRPLGAPLHPGPDPSAGEGWRGVAPHARTRARFPADIEGEWVAGVARSPSATTSTHLDGEMLV